MDRFKDLTGQKFGKLTPLCKIKENGKTLWKCRCDCGNYTLASSYNLVNGHKKSCGCYKYEATKTHGMTNSRIHTIWCRMRARCNQKSYEHFDCYGGRGIKVCDEWQGEDGFVNFYLWSMNNGYDDNLSIDRIDVNGNYSPENCRWATQKEQANNKRTNVLYTLNGETLTQTQWGKRIGINPDLIHARIVKLGWSVEKALTTPLRRRC